MKIRTNNLYDAKITLLHMPTKQAARQRINKRCGPPQSNPHPQQEKNLPFVAMCARCENTSTNRSKSIPQSGLGKVATDTTPLTQHKGNTLF